MRDGWLALRAGLSQDTPHQLSLSWSHSTRTLLFHATPSRSRPARRGPPLAPPVHQTTWPPSLRLTHAHPPQPPAAPPPADPTSARQRQGAQFNVAALSRLPRGERERWDAAVEPTPGPAAPPRSSRSLLQLRQELVPELTFLRRTSMGKRTARFTRSQSVSKTVRGLVVNEAAGGRLQL